MNKRQRKKALKKQGAIVEDRSNLAIVIENKFDGEDTVYHYLPIGTKVRVKKGSKCYPYDDGAYGTYYQTVLEDHLKFI